MFLFNGKEYDRVWFTSDEHYGSDRHLQLSKRLDFNEELKNYRRRREIQESPDIPSRSKKMILMSYYGATMYTPVDAMNETFIHNHNLVVNDNDLVFHLGDFGNYEYSKKLNGHHVLLMGNYEYDDCKKNYDGNIPEFIDMLKTKYNFIEVLANYKIDLSNPAQNFIGPGNQEITELFMTHKPEDCIWLTDRDTGVKNPDIAPDFKFIMNLFGHIHEKGKIKRFGLNVGIDCHHYYPVSQEDVAFYLAAILHHYDDNVFM